SPLCLWPPAPPALARLSLHDALPISPATLALGTAVRVDSQAGTAPDGRPILALHTLDGARSGYMSGGDLRPRDSVGPNVWTLDRSEEHTSELQSRVELVCRLPLGRKN